MSISTLNIIKKFAFLNYVLLSRIDLYFFIFYFRKHRRFAVFKIEHRYILNNRKYL